MPTETIPARRLRDALEPIATLAFHSAPAKDAYAALGLTEFGHRYFWSRSCVLGEPDASVVTATFGVWPSDFVRTNLEIGRSRASLDEIRRANETGAGAAARQVLADTDEHEVREITAALRRGINAADGTARSLFAANRALTWPSDAYAELWRAAFAWRELRGDSHLAACVVTGIPGLHANILNELVAGYALGEYTKTRYWADEDIAAAAEQLRTRGLIEDDGLTEAGTELREQIERWTDLAVEPAVAAVGADLDHVVATAEGWSQLIIDRGWFPDDQKKRDAG